MLIYIKFLFPKRCSPVNRKKEVPQETIMDEEASNESVPSEAREPTDVLNNWPELQRLVVDGEPIGSLFEKGWRPLLKSKPNGKQYMTLRLHGKDPESGEMIDTERGIGILDPENPEKWETLVTLYEDSKPPLPSVAKSPYAPPNTSQSSTHNRSSILTTKVGRIAPIGPSVQIKLETLQWYAWVQASAGYPGTLDDFINQSVDTLFRDHYKLELAVVNQKEENC